MRTIFIYFLGVCIGFLLPTYISFMFISTCLIVLDMIREEDIKELRNEIEKIKKQKEN